jgi:putative PIN family toxin of toxin-antitoxin system
MRNNKIKIVVDTNVFINGLIFSSENKDDENVINILFNLIDTDVVELVFSQDTIGELVYIYKNKLIHYVDIKKWEKHMYRIMMIFLYSYSVNTTHTRILKCKDPTDNIFLKCAKQSYAKYLISNDLRSKMSKVKSPYTRVLTSKEFLNIYHKINQQSKDESASDIEE